MEFECREQNHHPYLPNYVNENEFLVNNVYAYLYVNFNIAVCAPISLEMINMRVHWRATSNKIKPRSVRIFCLLKYLWKKNHLAFSNIPMQWKRKDPTCLSNPKIWKRKRLALETEALSPSTVLAQSWLKKNGESDDVVFVMLSDMGLRDFRTFSGVKISLKICFS